jgi:pyruvate formate lyase activating enzyme
VRICGVQGVSAIDYPGRIASVLFIGGCNFRCPFCQNPDLVLRPEELDEIGVETALDMLSRRRGLVDGAVVTGGEPLLQRQAVLELLRALRQIGFAVKLDTNGYEVDTLATVLDEALVDYVAMDVKTSPHRYSEAAGRTVDGARIRDAMTLIKDAGVAHEFRTTCVPGLVQPEDIVTIASLVGPGSAYALQQFRATEPLLDPSCALLKPYTAETLRSFADIARPLVGALSLRGI